MSPVAGKIIEQLGGISRLQSMVNARDLVEEEQGVNFRFSGCRDAQKFRVALLPGDTYRVELIKLGERSAPSGRTVFAMEGIQASGLIPLFEQKTGLYLTLAKKG